MYIEHLNALNWPTRGRWCDRVGEYPGPWGPTDVECRVRTRGHIYVEHPLSRRTAPPRRSRCRWAAFVQLKPPSKNMRLIVQRVRDCALSTLYVRYTPVKQYHMLGMRATVTTATSEAVCGNDVCWPQAPDTEEETVILYILDVLRCLVTSSRPALTPDGIPSLRQHIRSVICGGEFTPVRKWS